MTLGEISPRMAARIDSNVYYNSLSKAQNVIIMNEGGIRRRPGLTKVKDSLVDANSKMFKFEFSSSQDYLIIMSTYKIRIYKDGVLQKELKSPYIDANVVYTAQTADTMVLTSKTIKPHLLRRLGADDKWELIPLPFVTIPNYKFETVDEPIWSEKRGWPTVCAFYQNRLFLAGSQFLPNSILGSQVNDFFDFDLGSGQDDYGIFDSLNTDQYNEITAIHVGRNLQVFTTGAEFYNTAEIMTPKLSSWKKTSSYGAKSIKPVDFKGSTVFVDNIGRNIFKTEFDFNIGAYKADSLSNLSEHLLKEILTIDIIRGTNTDITTYLYVINKDGTAAVMNSTRTATGKDGQLIDSTGWVQWKTNHLTDDDSKFKDVKVVNNITYFLCERNNGEWHLEYLNEGTTLDHNTYVKGSPITTVNVTHNNINVTYNNTDVIFYASTTPPVTELNVNETTNQQNLPHKVIIDYSIQPDQKPVNNIIKLLRPSESYAETGLDVKIKIETNLIGIPLKNGNTITEIKRVNKVNLLLNNSSGVKMGQISHSGDRSYHVATATRTFKVTLDRTQQPFSGLKQIRLLGFNRLQKISISQDQPLPLEVLAIGAEVVV